jgi:hypothetical protein
MGYYGSGRRLLDSYENPTEMGPRFSLYGLQLVLPHRR